MNSANLCKPTQPRTLESCTLQDRIFVGYAHAKELCYVYRYTEYKIEADLCTNTDRTFVCRGEEDERETPFIFVAICCHFPLQAHSRTVRD